MKSIHTNGALVDQISADFHIPTQEIAEFVKYVLRNYGVARSGILVDVMAGVGGILYAAESFGWETIGFEIRSELVRLGNQRLHHGRVIVADSTEPLDVADEYCDLVFFVPPLPNLSPGKYPDKNQIIKKFRANSEVYLRNMRKILHNTYPILKKDCNLVFSTRSVRLEDGQELDLPAIFGKYAKEVGYRFVEKIIHKEARSLANVNDKCFICVYRKR